MPVMPNESMDLLCHPVSFIASAAVSNRHLQDACTSRNLASPGDDPAALCLSSHSHRQSKGAQSRLRSGVGEITSALWARHLSIQHLGSRLLILLPSLFGGSDTCHSHEML